MHGVPGMHGEDTQHTMCVHAAMSAFGRGLAAMSVLPPMAPGDVGCGVSLGVVLSSIHPDDLNLALGGVGGCLDVSLLRRCTQFVPRTPNSTSETQETQEAQEAQEKAVDIFWDMMTNTFTTDTMRRSVLCFWSGSRAIPADTAAVTYQLMVHDADPPAIRRLPNAITCLRQLFIPRCCACAQDMATLFEIATQHTNMEDEEMD